MTTTSPSRVLTLLDVTWWGHRYWACELASWLLRRDVHQWDRTGATTPPACGWCGRTRTAHRRRRRRRAN